MKTKEQNNIDAIAKSKDFYDKYRNEIGKKIFYETQLHEPIAIEYNCNIEQFEDILHHIENVWMQLGKKDAHWSVVSTSDFRADRIKDTIKQFNESGRVEIENMKRLIARIGMDISHLESALEYGCGVGRVTRWLAEIFPQVTGVDVSTNHLDLALRYFADEDIGNINTIKISKFQDVEILPNFDFLYSKIVLQHNPPPVIHRTLDILSSKINSGGVGVVQIPTYCKNYSFDVKSYIKSMDQQENMEMHVLPQHAIFDILYKHGCHIREVFRDHLINSVDFVSTTFVFEKK